MKFTLKTNKKMKYLFFFSLLLLSGSCFAQPTATELKHSVDTGIINKTLPGTLRHQTHGGILKQAIDLTETKAKYADTINRLIVTKKALDSIDALNIAYADTLNRLIATKKMVDSLYALVVKYVDTAAMLSNYLHEADTASLSTRINARHLQGGSTFGATNVIGSADNNKIEIKANGVLVATYHVGGKVNIGSSTTASTATNSLFRTQGIGEFGDGSNGTGIYLRRASGNSVATIQVLASDGTATGRYFGINGGLRFIASASNVGTADFSAGANCYTQGGLGVGIEPDAGTINSKAQLEVVSTTKGALICRMTEVQRDAMTANPEGLLIYNLTAHKYQFHNGTSWTDL
jgi:hypothetical protein